MCITADLHKCKHSAETALLSLCCNVCFSVFGCHPALFSVRVGVSVSMLLFPSFAFSSCVCPCFVDLCVLIGLIRVLTACPVPLAHLRIRSRLLCIGTRTVIVRQFTSFDQRAYSISQEYNEFFWFLK